jgi:PII-like signaling protein
LTTYEAITAMMVQVQLFLDEQDSFQEISSSEHILRYLLHHKIMGATMFKGHMGFGERRHLNAPRRIAASDANPVMILFIDDEEKVRHVIPHIREVLAGGLIVSQKVERL